MFNNIGKFGITIGVVTLIAFLICASTTMAQQPQWVIYNADALPEIGAIFSDVNIEGTIEDGALHVNTIEGAPFSLKRTMPDLSSATMEVRVKVVETGGNQTGWSAYFGIHDPESVAYVLCEDVSLQVYASGCGGWQPCPNEVDFSEFHTVRLTKDGTDFKVYLDGELLWEGQGEAGEVEEPVITLGDGTGTSDSNSYWDYIAFTLGAFDPTFPVGTAVEPVGKLATTWAEIKR
jgi:hypothetical protein